MEFYWLTYRKCQNFLFLKWPITNKSRVCVPASVPALRGSQFDVIKHKFVHHTYARIVFSEMWIHGDYVWWVSACHANISPITKYHVVGIHGVGVCAFWCVVQLFRLRQNGIRGMTQLLAMIRRMNMYLRPFLLTSFLEATLPYIVTIIR